MASGEPDASWPPLFRRHVGRWAGTATHLSPTGGLLDTHATELRQGIRGLAFAQRNTYRWAAEDGGEGAREEVHDFPGQWDATTGTLHIESARLKGFARVVDDDCLVFYATYKSTSSLPLAPGGGGDGEAGGGAPDAAGPDVDVYDLIRLVGDDRRYRTWQVRRGGDIVKLVHVAERRVTADDPFIEMC